GTKSNAERPRVGRLPQPNPRRVDAVGRQQFVGRDPQVGGRETKLSTSAGAVLNPRAEEVIAPQQLGGGTHLTEHDEPPDSRAADRRSAPRQRRCDRNGEPRSDAQPAEESRVAPAALTEAEVLAGE